MAMGFGRGDLQHVNAHGVYAALRENAGRRVHGCADFRLRPFPQIDCAQLQSVCSRSGRRETAQGFALLDAQAQGFVRAYCRCGRQGDQQNSGLEQRFTRDGANSGAIDQNLGNLSCALAWRSPSPAFLGLFTEISTENVHAFSCHALERGAATRRSPRRVKADRHKKYFRQKTALGGTCFLI